MSNFYFDRDVVQGRLVEELKTLGDNPATIAHALGCTRRQTRDWLGGKYFPGFYYLMLMARFGCDVHYILTGERASFPGGDKSCTIYT